MERRGVEEKKGGENILQKIRSRAGAEGRTKGKERLRLGIL